MLSPDSKKLVKKALKQLTPGPDGPTASIPDWPGYLVYRLDVDGEPEVGVIYRFTQQNKFMRRRFWIADIVGDHLPVG